MAKGLTKGGKDGIMGARRLGETERFFLFYWGTRSGGVERMVMLQGNTYWLAVRVEDCGGKVVGGDRVARGRFEVGGIVKYYGEGGEVVWDEQVGAFLFPLSEEETFTLSGGIEYQARVVLEDGTVCGSVPEEYYVYESLSKELIGDGGYGTQNGVVLSAKLVNYVQGTGTTDYEKLKNKPSINGVELIGDKTTQELGIVSEETDPTVPTHVKAIREQDISNWNGKVDQEQLEEINNNITALGQNKADVSYVEEVESIAKGANQAVSFGNYATMITALNALDAGAYNVGQNVMIVTLNVPDLWISAVEETSVSYTYGTDEQFVADLSANGSVQVGHYKLSVLETQKVDLADYVKNTDYATETKGGVVKSSSYGGILVGGDGVAYISPATNANIDAKTQGVNKPIVPATLDYAVKVGLTTNTIELTDEEKTKAQTWLGIPQIELTLKENGAYTLTINKG